MNIKELMEEYEKLEKQFQRCIKSIRECMELSRGKYIVKEYMPSMRITVFETSFYHIGEAFLFAESLKKTGSIVSIKYERRIEK